MLLERALLPGFKLLGQALIQTTDRAALVIQATMVLTLKAQGSMWYAFSCLQA
jgi:hypothetical protein